jgi:hypothetical protein
MDRSAPHSVKQFLAQRHSQKVCQQNSTARRPTDLFAADENRGAELLRWRAAKPLTLRKCFERDTSLVYPATPRQKLGLFVVSAHRPLCNSLLLGEFQPRHFNGTFRVLSTDLNRTLMCVEPMASAVSHRLEKVHAIHWSHFHLPWPIFTSKNGNRMIIASARLLRQMATCIDIDQCAEERSGAVGSFAAARKPQWGP